MESLAEQTKNGLGMAVESLPAKGEEMDSWWLAQGIDPGAMRGFILRHAANMPYADSASIVVGLAIGVGLGKLMSDPTWGLELAKDAFRCPVDSCEFRSSVRDYHGISIVCPMHGNEMVPVQEGWE